MLTFFLNMKGHITIETENRTPYFQSKVLTADSMLAVTVEYLLTHVESPKLPMSNLVEYK